MNKLAIAGLAAVGLLVPCCGVGGVATLASNSSSEKVVTQATPTFTPVAAPTEPLYSPTETASTSVKAQPTSSPTSSPKRTQTKTASPRPTATKTASPKPTKTSSKPVYYKNCAAVKAAGKAPIHRGDPGYGRHLDRDGDGIGCEK